jgi:thiamine biosynthesis lipoprotein
MPKASPPNAIGKTNIWSILLVAILSNVPVPANAQPARQPFEAVEPHMGTLVRIKLFTEDAPQARAAFRAAFDRIADLDSILSDYQPESELNRLCRTPAGHPVIVSEDLFEVLAAAQKLADRTAGAFDVTLGPLTRLWRQARKHNRLPEAVALRDASARSGYPKLHLDASRRAVTLDAPGMQLDLGGIAKGYAADAALDTLRARGIQSALVAISGDIVCGDPPPGTRGWKIAAEPLPEAGRAFESVLELANAAVSTSGDAEQHLESHGERYSHIVDPATGQGITSRIGVTVVAPRGIEADGLATAVSLLGAEQGLRLIAQQPETEALIAIRENEKTRLVESPRFRNLIAAPEQNRELQPH